MDKFKLTLLLASICVTCVSTAKEKNVVCYYASWATYRVVPGKFDVSHIDTHLCTHLVYTYAGLSANGELVPLDPYLDLPDNWGRNNYGKFNDLKNTNRNLKTILSVGGWNEGSAKFSMMAASTSTRNHFITSAIRMLRRHGFDGLDVAWEYPGRRDTVHGTYDKGNFVQLLKELREEFDKYGLMLMAAVSATQDVVPMSYDIPKISQYLDLINVMTYDLSGSWDGYTGHNSPLLGQGNDYLQTVHTVNASIKYWLSEGCPPEKLLLGIPLYGHTYKLKYANWNGVGDPTNGPGIPGPYTGTQGSIGYNEFCEKLNTESWELRYDVTARAPYAIQNDNWISFENTRSVIEKVQFALELNLSGIMVWSIDTDDFNAHCHDEKYHLLRTINENLNRTINSTILNNTADGINTMEVKTDPTESFKCSQEGLTGDPQDCASFFICMRDVNGELVPKRLHCPNNLLWDQAHLFCNYPQEVACNM